MVSSSAAAATSFVFLLGACLASCGVAAAASVQDQDQLGISRLLEGSSGWSYDHEDEWTGSCNSNTGRQSPIDVVTSSLVSCPTNTEVEFHAGSCDLDSLSYVADGAVWKVGDLPTACAVKPYMTVGGKQYDLLQMHFHSLSEHTIDGTYEDGEWHFVHLATDGSIDLRVVGLLLKSSPTEEFTALSPYWHKLESASIDSEHRRQLAEGVTLNPYDLLPANKDYYTYLGSLTSPPCDEVVTWMVLKQSMTMSISQIAKFRGAVAYHEGSIVDEEGNTNRSLQPLNGRAVASCAACPNKAWGKCGGKSWTGSSCCPVGQSCKFVNQYYSQCKP